MQTTLIFGIHPVLAALRKAPESVLEAWVLEGREDSRMSEVLSLLREAGIKPQKAPRKTLDQMTDGEIHQGIVIKAREQPAKNETDLVNFIRSLDHPPFIIILDDVTDPRNLGAAFRAADAAGCDCLVAPRDKSAGLTGVVRKTACGAAESVPFFQVSNLARALDALKKENVWVVGTSDHAEKLIYETDLTGPLALVMGAEGKGLRRLTIDSCDLLVKLPMKGRVSSLNVSVAAGICLFEALRQRDGLGRSASSSASSSASAAASASA